MVALSCQFPQQLSPHHITTVFTGLRQDRKHVGKPVLGGFPGIVFRFLAQPGRFSCKGQLCEAVGCPPRRRVMSEVGSVSSVARPFSHEGEHGQRIGLTAVRSLEGKGGGFASLSVSLMTQRKVRERSALEVVGGPVRVGRDHVARPRNGACFPLLHRYLGEKYVRCPPEQIRMAQTPAPLRRGLQGPEISDIGEGTQRGLPKGGWRAQVPSFLPTVLLEIVSQSIDRLTPGWQTRANSYPPQRNDISVYRASRISQGLSEPFVSDGIESVFRHIAGRRLLQKGLWKMSTASQSSGVHSNIEYGARS